MHGSDAVRPQPVGYLGKGQFRELEDYQIQFSFQNLEFQFFFQNLETQFFFQNLENLKLFFFTFFRFPTYMLLHLFSIDTKSLQLRAHSPNFF